MKEDTSTYLKVDRVDPVYVSMPEDVPYINGVQVWIGDNGHFFPCDHIAVCDPDIAIETGHREVVELMNELMTMMIADKKELFGYVTARDILNHFSYKEIVEKLDAWKKEKETIRVRDEVYSQAYEMRFVITKIYTPCDGDTIVNGLKKDGTAIKGLLLCNVEKTGIRVDDLDAYLEV